MLLVGCGGGPFFGVGTENRFGMIIFERIFPYAASSLDSVKPFLDGTGGPGTGKKGRKHEQSGSRPSGRRCRMAVPEGMGLNAEAYDYVVRAIGASANRIVFFDDTLENVEGARARGLQAVHVKSSADLADALAILIERRRAVKDRSR